MKLYGHPIGALLKRTGKEIGRDRLTVYAAQMAYTFFFALFPLLLFTTALLGLVVDQHTVMGWVNTRLTSTLPAGVATLVNKTAVNVIAAKGKGGLLSFGFLLALWSGSSLFGSFRDALNQAYDVSETRPFWKQWLLQIAMLVAAGLVLLVATVVLLKGNAVLGWLGNTLHLSGATTLIWTIVQYPLAIGAVILIMWAQYYYLPNVRHQNKTAVLVGTIVAAVLWTALTLLFRVYVAKFNALNPAYGTIGAIMVLLTWMYYSSFVLLAAGELNSELRAHQPGVARDGSAAPPDVDPSRPLPDRGSNLPVRVGSSADVSHEGDGTGQDGRAGIGGLFSRLAHGSATLLRLEVGLARTELATVARGVGGGSALIATGAVLALIGGLTLLTGIVLLVGDQWLPRDLYFVAAATFVVITGALAWWSFSRGMDRLNPDVLVPHETVATVEETTEWAAHELRSTTKSH